MCKVKQVAAVKERTFHQPLLGDTSAYQTSVVSASDPWKGLCYLSEVCVLYALLLFQGLESLLSKLQKPATAVLGETYWSVGDYMRWPNGPFWAKKLWNVWKATDMLRTCMGISVWHMTIYTNSVYLLKCREQYPTGKMNTGLRCQSIPGQEMPK